MESQLRVGVVTSTHGLKGEVKVYPTTDTPDRFFDIEKVYIKIGRDQKRLEIENVRFFKEQVILKFKGMNRIEDVENFRQCELYIDREDAVACEENENYIGDLIDMDVVTEDGQYLGVLTDVYETGANDVYIVETKAGKELMIPAIPDCILEVDLEKNEMTVHLLDGLLDL
ncbi:MAG: ribosome maturation factor RimM [Lachnospiraceae bacterium]